MRRHPTTQDITWFLDQDRNKQLQLNPSYQRRSVWTNKDRRFFLNTIFSGYPCPAIFLHKRVSEDGRATYDVVDGKQRLETILMFSQNKISVDSEFGDNRLAGKKWRDLGELERKIFWNYVLPVELLDFEEGETGAVNDAFDRLNRNSRKLEPQELRHARYDGWFIKTIEEECQSKTWQTLGVVTAARSKRMKDAQFISELALVVLEKKQSGFDQNHLDEAYAKYDDAEDEGTPLDTDEFSEQMAKNKSFLMQMNAINGAVKTSASTVGAFYTLWSLLVLHHGEIPPPAELAEKYAVFVNLAAKIRFGVIEPELDGLGTPNYEAAVAYANALQGAHTDFTPRNIRLQALLQAMRI